MRVMLFTDTLGDVNGVSRFIRNAAEQAQHLGLDLTVVTSTRFDVPDAPNIISFKPRAATRMPKYEHLEIVWPPFPALWRAAQRFKPDAIHVSTPGSVGLAGRRIAKRLGVPILGVYHTDFPAYVDHLFDDTALTWLTTAAMKWFYRGFSRIFTRSADYAVRLVDMGAPEHTLVRLLPGIDLSTFQPRFAGKAEWAGVDTIPGVRPSAVKLLYVGRVSVEKNLPFLVSLWPRVVSACAAKGVDAQLLVVGDGPYLSAMRTSLSPQSAALLGFKHGAELSRLYASCDAFVFPSTTDTLGQAVMEAQASGLPVLVSDQGGPREVVRHGVTGFVLPAEDPRAWVLAMVDLLTDPRRRQAMSHAAHEFMQGFSFPNSFQHFWRIHEEAITQHRGTLPTAPAATLTAHA